MFRRSRNRKGHDRFTVDLQAEVFSVDNDSVYTDELPTIAWLTDEEFLHKYRMSRPSFFRILDLIKDHKLFQPKTKRGRKQAPVAHQLMVFLKFLGTEGAGSSNANQRHMFAIGYGTSGVYRKRVLKAILSLRESYLS